MNRWRHQSFQKTKIFFNLRFYWKYRKNRKKPNKVKKNKKLGSDENGVLTSKSFQNWIQRITSRFKITWWHHWWRHMLIFIFFKCWKSVARSHRHWSRKRSKPFVTWRHRWSTKVDMTYTISDVIILTPLTNHDMETAIISDVIKRTAIYETIDKFEACDWLGESTAWIKHYQIRSYDVCI